MMFLEARARIAHSRPENPRGVKVARRTVNGCNGSLAAAVVAMIVSITEKSPGGRTVFGMML